MLICPLFVLSVLTALFALFALSELTALFALAWRFEPTMVVVLFGVLRFVIKQGAMPSHLIGRQNN
jgi:hypothetical protein